MFVKNIKWAIFKIDLAKAFDKVSWIYLHLHLMHLGFDIVFIRWILSCITTVSFLVLIDGAASPFFHAERGLRQGYPLSPLLFLLAVEGLSCALKEVIWLGNFIGLQLAQNLHISNFLFVDDIFIFCSGSVRELCALDDILNIFSKETWMDINIGKSMVIPYLLSREEERVLSELFPFHTVHFEEGIHYLGFFIKPNYYRKQDWAWLLEKLDKWLKLWCHPWLMRADRLIMIKYLLDAILVYWMTLASILKGILDKACRI